MQSAAVLEAGRGVKQNYQRAAQLYRQACDDANGEACARLANLYDRGAGVRRDTDRAVSFRKRACEYKYAEACEKPKGA